ncbi:hypothetical protein [Dethiothermospora halolimnae]|uniref:hypothetical protein n=1 Tax=Dethiothermospora halolimnae TaxID=3114390 RepID=UPI003CCBC29F
MIIDKINNLILKITYEDIKGCSFNYINNKLCSDIEDNIYKWSYITQTMIMTIKSLKPLKDKIGNSIDYRRFKEELDLWYYYKNGYNGSLINIIDNNDLNYFNDIDDSIYTRILPIILSNTNWDIIKDEVIKNVLYTTGNIETLLEAILLSKAIYLIMEGKERDYEDIIKEIKEDVINLSQIDFNNRYGNCYRINIAKYRGNYSIDFERKKISLLNLLNGIHQQNYFPTLKETLNIMKGNKKESEYKNLFIIGLTGLCENNSDYEFNGKLFINSLCKYIYKLRKGRIDPQNLRIEVGSSSDVFKFKESDSFKHPLLNDCLVLKRFKSQEHIITYIKTKTGTYRFIKNIKK